MKKVAIASKPKQPVNAEQWVKNRDMGSEPMKRFTVDIPLNLHTEIKTRCAQSRVKMADEIRVLLERHFNSNFQPISRDSSGGEKPL